MNNIISNIILIVLIVASGIAADAQSPREQYLKFKQQVAEEYKSFRDECNKKYQEFLKEKWEDYYKDAPVLRPKEDKFPPKPYNGDGKNKPTTIVPVDIDTLEDILQPEPLEPIPEIPVIRENYKTVDFYGINCKIRLPESARTALKDCSANSIAVAWEVLAGKEMNNAIRDCLETRTRYNLCDWAYLMFLDKLGREFCSDTNGATFLTAFLYCQSGYQMRLGIDGHKLILLFGSKHQIFDKGFFVVDGLTFYPLCEPTNSIKICAVPFEGETPMSLVIDKEQLLGEDMSVARTITAKRYLDVSVTSQVPQNLVNFYNEYPTSAIDGNPMTRWAMYAKTPLSQKTRDCLYPKLREVIKDLSEQEAANKLLNLVQTGFAYEYDDKVWGHDRAFFAEETLYYPYCDCEDRSILFSRLIRDLLGLDVALIYYPGHLATAVCFDGEVNGDALSIGGRIFIVCDPTYIGAPVGAQMPGLEYDKAQAFVL